MFFKTPFFVFVRIFIFFCGFLINVNSYSQVTPACTPIDFTCSYSAGGSGTGQFSSNGCISNFTLIAGIYEASDCVGMTIGTNDTFQINRNILITGDLIIDLNQTGSVFEILAGSTLEVTGNLIITGNSNQERQLVIDGALVVGGILDLGERGNGDDQTIEIDGSGSVSAGSINNGGNTTCEDTSTCPTFNVDGPCEPAGVGLCTEAALPIELGHFDVQSNDKNVSIEWSTLTEINNDFFTIQRSKDGLIYEDIATIIGAGNSVTLRNYIFIDKNPFFGRSYYRLKQTDYDGAFEIFYPVTVDFTSLEKGSLRFDNPVAAGDQVTIYANTDASEVLQVTVFSMIGEKIVSESFSGNTYSFQLSTDVKPGIYFVKLSSVSSEQTGRLIVK